MSYLFLGDRRVRLVYMPALALALAAVSAASELPPVGDLHARADKALAPSAGMLGGDDDDQGMHVQRFIRGDDDDDDFGVQPPRALGNDDDDGGNVWSTCQCGDDYDDGANFSTHKGLFWPRAAELLAGIRLLF